MCKEELVLRVYYVHGLAIDLFIRPKKGDIDVAVVNGGQLGGFARPPKRCSRHERELIDAVAKLPWER